MNTRILKTILFPLACLMASGGTRAAALTKSMTSSPLQTPLLELYSSEGCSSCPPADRWLGGLRADPGLWKSFVPVEFHVDYWNHLGWIDRFSKSTFTSRQRSYARSWNRDSVYTPGFVLSGREWRPEGRAPSIEGARRVGVLQAVRVSPNRFRVTFSPEFRVTAPTVYGALLGNGFESRVSRGENSGETLRHEFVAIALASTSMKNENGKLVAEVELSPTGTVQPASLSAAFWVTSGDDPAPIQAVGGDLP